MAGQAGQDAAELQRMYAEVMLRMELLDLLYDFAPQVQGSTELAETLSVTATTIRELLAGGWCALLTLTDGQVQLAGWAGEIPAASARQMQAGELPLPGGQAPQRPSVISLPQQSLLVAPMAVRGVTMGWVVVGYPPGARDVDRRALELATGIGRQAAIALENARMVQQIRDEQAATAAANAALRQRETELQMLNARLAEATRLKSEFLAKMSHELRTPLNAIIGFSEALLAGVDGPLNDDQRESLAFIHQGGVNLLQLINDLLDLSKIEAGRMTVVPEELVLDDLLTHAVETLRPLADARGLRLELSVDPGLPMLITDPKRLRQVVVNLVGNAIKFTSQGGVRVTAGLVGPTSWELAVADTGIGIPSDRLVDIFAEFTQVEGSSTRKEGGTGLGLAICRKLAELLGGQIAVTSTVGVGSTFRVRLPVRYAPADRSDGDAGAEEDAAGAGSAWPMVLVIDDDPAIHRLVTKALDGRQLRVLAAGSGGEGVELARRHRPAAVILDLIMPDKDGWQVLQELRLDPRTRSVPVVVLTVLEQQALPSPVAGYLTKPLQPERLLAVLDQLPMGGAAIG